MRYYLIHIFMLPRSMKYFIFYVPKAVKKLQNFDIC